MKSGRLRRWVFANGQLLAMALLIAGLSDALAARELSTNRFAHVFGEHQLVRVMISAGEAVSVELRNVAGDAVVRREASAAAGELDFGLLEPGYYEVVAGETILPLVVVIDPARRVQSDSRLATDNAMSWLVNANQWENVADLLQLLGIHWVRERLNWGEIERQRGQFDWGRYDRTATILQQRGINVYQIFHHVPAWSRADKDVQAVPDDLRDVYTFSRALATQFRGRVQAWEAWNEPDIKLFFSHPSSECAALQKAAYLGFHAVDPDLCVLGPSMAYGAGTFSENLLENGTGQYLDVWNYHIYADPSAYAARRQGFRDQLGRHGIRVPDWITEAGDPLEGPEGVLGRAARIHQARFLSRAFPQGLAAGVERHFWFVFPYCREGNGAWGLFEPQQRAAHPAVAALATVTYALGRGDFLGSFAVTDPDARALAFARGDGTASVAVWRESDEPAEVTLPLEWEQVSDARSYLGTPLGVGQGPVQVPSVRAATFFIVPLATLQGKIIPRSDLPIAPAAEETPPAERSPLHEILVRLRVPKGTPDKAIDAYRLTAGVDATLEAEVYNFSVAEFQGALQLSAATGWDIDPKSGQVTLAPGQRAVLPVQLVVPSTKDPGEIRLVASSTAGQTAPAVVRLCANLDSLTPSRSSSLNLDDPLRWHKNIAGHGDMEIATGIEGGVRLSFRFSTNGDNWAYPRVDFQPELDWSAYDGLRFEYRTDTNSPGPVRVILFESGGAGYISDTELPGSQEWRSATVLFSQLGYVPATPVDPNGKLDMNRVGAVSIGAHCKPLSVVLEVRNLQAVKF